MIIQKCLKPFCTLSKNTKIKNLNTLINFVRSNYETLTNEELASGLNKFQEYEQLEPNAKLKLYDYMDYILIDKNRLSDVNLLKSMMRVMIALQLHDDLYWDYFKSIINDKNMLLSDNTNLNYLDFLKSYSIINYKENELWQVFEEYFLERNSTMKPEDVETIAICFANCKRGSTQFWETLIMNFNLMGSNSVNNIDFLLNFSISLCGFLQAKMELSQGVTALFSNYLNFSIAHLQKQIVDSTAIEKIDMIYPLFLNFHKSYYIDRINTKFPVKKDLLKSFVETLEGIMKNYLEKNISKLEDEDFEQISKILGYSNSQRVVFKELKQTIFVTIFIDNYNKIKNYQDLYNFLNYFMINHVGEKRLEKVFADEKLWEKFIENIHLMNFDQVYNLAKIIHFYNVKYVRLWIILQGYFKKNISEYKTLENINKLLTLFNDPVLKKEDYILVPFIFFMNKTKDELIVSESYKNNLI
jgi:hypothetical protein